MALAFRLQRAGFTPTELSAEAAAIGPLGLEYSIPPTIHASNKPDKPPH